MPDVIKIDKQALFGSRIFGTGIFGHGSPREYVVSRDPGTPPDTIQHAGYRNDSFRSRAFRVAVDLKIPALPPVSGDVEIRFLTSRDQLLGTESTAIRRPIISNVSTTWKPRGGCINASITLSRLPDFSFRDTMIVELSIAGQAVFRGLARYSEAEGSTLDEVRIEAEGGTAQIENVREDLVVPGPVDLGRVFRDLFLAVRNQTSIRYTESLINTTTGVTSAGNIELNRANWRDVFDTLALATNHQWGVDADSYIYFLPAVRRVQQTYLVGYQINDFQPERNYESVCNSLLIKRAVGKGSGGSGWIVAATGKNLTSIANHGLHHREIEMPGLFDDDLAESILSEVLENNADPSWSAALKDIEIKSREDLVLERGPIRVVSAPTEFRDLVQQCEQLEDFTLFNLSGFSTILITENPRFSGAACLKYRSDGGAAGDIVTFDLDPPRAQFFQAAIWRVFSPFALGDLLEIGAGWTSWAEEQDIARIGFRAEWFEVSQKLTGTRIGQMGFRVLTSEAFEIYLDAVELKSVGHRTYELELDEVQLTMSPDKGVSMDLKLGPQPQGLFERVAALADLAESTNAMGEVR